MKKILTMSIFCMALISCNSTKNTAVENSTSSEVSLDNSLEGKWMLSYIASSEADSSIDALFPNRTPYLSFDIHSNKLNGSDGCNNLMGDFKISGQDGIAFDKVGSTLMACTDVHDYLFKQTLNKVNKYGIDNNELLLYEDNTLIMKFAKEEQSLIGNWTLEKIQPKDKSAKTLEMRFPNKKPALNFKENGKLNGNTGCNSLMSTYQFEGNSLSIGETATTRMFCDDVEEHLFLENLAMVKKFKFEDDKLILSTEDDLDLFTFKKTE